MKVGDQIKKIKTGQRLLHLNDDEYRDLLFGLTGKRSCTEMNFGERAVVIAKMTEMGAFKKAKLSAKKRRCLALWYNLYDIGQVEQRGGLNGYIKPRFGSNLTGLSEIEAEKLANQLQVWLDKGVRSD